MRPAIYVAAAIGLAAIAPSTARELLAGSASVLLESLPYLAAVALLSPVLGRFASLAAFVGCGCTRGPAARSIPAAIALAFVFGPLPAALRVLAAGAVWLPRALEGSASHQRTPPSLLGDLADLAPAALASAGLAMLAAHLTPAHWPPAAAAALGAVLGFFASPCALGQTAIAVSLHASSPFASFAYLSIAGIVDVHALQKDRHAHRCENDSLAYVMLAAACALAAYERGASLVHPRLALVLVPAAALFLQRAWQYRGHRCGTARWLPFALVAALVIGAPAPIYTATETTMSGIFPGERVDFTGALTRAHGRAALVRYAITCCRADAQPVTIALSRDVRFPQRTWLHAEGVIVRNADALSLNPQYIEAIAPPADPFVYR